MKIFEKAKKTAKEVVYNASAVAVPVACAAAMTITSFAAEGGTDYSTVTTALTNGFSNVATQIISVAGVAITGGIGIFGLKKLVSAAMSFFSKIVGR